MCSVLEQRLPSWRFTLNLYLVSHEEEGGRLSMSLQGPGDGAGVLTLQGSWFSPAHAQSFSFCRTRATAEEMLSKVTPPTRESLGLNSSL